VQAPPRYAFAFVNTIYFFVCLVNEPAMCMRFGSTAGIATKTLAFHLIVRDAMASTLHGSVRCVPGSLVQFPVHVEWRINGKLCNPSDIDVDSTGLYARQICPGTECSVSVTDRTGTTETASVVVDVIDVPVLTEYVCTPASAERSRDGTVEAKVLHAPKGCLFLWTSGIVTREPILHNVTPGVYAATPITADHGMVLYVNAASPCRVSVRPRGV
jgi:hypothetical protein